MRHLGDDNAASGRDSAASGCDNAAIVESPSARKRAIRLPNTCNKFSKALSRPCEGLVKANCCDNAATAVVGVCKGVLQPINTLYYDNA